MVTSGILKFMKKLPRRKVATNTSGAFGYLCAFLAWMMFASVVIIGMAGVQTVIILDEPVSPAGQSSSDELSAIAITVGYGVTALAIAATLVVTVFLPYLVGKWGSGSVRRLMVRVNVEPTMRNLFSTKLALVLIPALGMFVFSLVQPPMSELMYAMLVLGSLFSVLATVLFVVQFLCAKWMRVVVKDVW